MMLTTSELSQRWQVSVKTLGTWRRINRGSKFIKIGNRVMYRMEDVLEFERNYISGSIDK